MARPAMQGVEYFPHDTDISGKTLYTLEAMYDNTGYAFWFKMLEILGRQDGLYFDCNNEPNWMYLVARTKTTPQTATEILNLLAALDAIDKELWQHKIIWVQKFVDRVASVFKKRGTETPSKPNYRDRNTGSCGVSDTESTQSKVKESRVKKSIYNTPVARDGFALFWDKYPKKKSKSEAQKSWDKLKPDDALFAKIMAALEQHKKSADWTKDGGQFIPYPATWINKRRWEDEATEAPKSAPKVDEDTARRYSKW